MDDQPFSFAATIDESGHESDDFTKGGTEWFVLSAVIHRTDDEIAALSAIDELQAALHKPLGKRKYSDLKPKHQIHFARALAARPVHVVNIIVHKPSVRDQSFLTDHRRFYSYVGKFLLERISWVCRDLWRGQPGGDPNCMIVFSKNRRFSYDNFRAYLERLLVDAGEGIGQYNSSIVWRHINHNLVYALDHKDWQPHLLSDLAASAVGQALQYTDLNITDDRAARELHPVIHKSGEKHVGYGLKLWPREAEGLIETDPRLTWIRHYYD